MPVGTGTYKGLAVPRYDESEIVQQTTLDALTLQHSSANAGNFLVFRDNVSSEQPLKGEGSTVTASDLLKIDGSGSVVGASTVLGDATIAGYRRPVVESTVGQELTIAQSGTLFIVSSAVGTSLTFDLPTGSGVPGTWYDFWCSSDVTSGDVRIAASSGVAAKIHMVGAGSSAASSQAAITVGTQAAGNLGSFFGRVTAATSLLWLFEANSGYSSISTLAQNDWKAGSTAA